MTTDRSAVIVLLLRCYLALALFLPLGITKLAGYPASAAGMVTAQQETILGSALMLPTLYLFAYTLPFVETLGGLALLAGWQTRRVFLMLACALVLLGFGTTLAGRISTTADNLIFLAACLGGYWLADADRYGFSAWRRSRT